MDIPSFPQTPFGLLRELPDVPYAEAVQLARAALGSQGFGILTEIDMRATLKAKLGAEVRDYVILGACNPPLAHKALALEPGVGLLLPCNVVVSADDNGGAVVAAVDPLALFAVSGRADLEEVAREVHDRLVLALDALSASAEAR
jgi:uncharacterized protein (DUF302 family)